MSKHICPRCNNRCACEGDGNLTCSHKCRTDEPDEVTSLPERIIYSTVSDERAALLEMGREMIEVMRQIIEPVNLIACRLDAHAAMLTRDSIDENENKPKRRATSKTPIEGTAQPKRTCSICRQSGHRANTCPSKPQ